LTVLRHLGCLVLGAAVALAAVAVHRSGPLGLLLALAASALTVGVLSSSGRPRLATSYAAGWLVVFGAVVAGRPEGDYAVASDVDGYALMVTSLVVVVGGVSGLRRMTA
jgi:hypothetical protein